MGSVEGPICMGRLLGRWGSPLTVCLLAAPCLVPPPTTGFDSRTPPAPAPTPTVPFLRFSAASIVKWAGTITKSSASWVESGLEPGPLVIVFVVGVAVVVATVVVPGVAAMVRILPGADPTGGEDPGNPPENYGTQNYTDAYFIKCTDNSYFHGKTHKFVCRINKIGRDMNQCPLFLQPF